MDLIPRGTAPHRAPEPWPVLPRGTVIGPYTVLYAVGHAARRHLDRADANLIGAVDGPEVGQVWAVRALVEHAAGDRGSADRALARAEGIAADLAVGPASDLALRLTRARRVLGRT